MAEWECLMSDQEAIHEGAAHGDLSISEMSGPWAVHQEWLKGWRTGLASEGKLCVL